MAVEQPKARRQGPLAASNGRLKNFWKREANPPSGSSTPLSSHQPAFQEQFEVVQSASQHSSHTQAPETVGLTSPSVEPPQISAYKLGPSPSPAFWMPGNQYYGYQSNENPYQSDGASMPPAQPLRVNSLPLEGIAEMGSSLGHREQHGDNTTVSSASTEIGPGDHSHIVAPSPQQASAPAHGYSGSQSQRLHRKPVQKRIHPDGDRITPQIGHFKPPEDVVNHAEVIRHGSEFVIISDVLSPRGEINHEEGGLDYQLAISPPVNQREAPPAIILDPRALAFQPRVGPSPPETTMQVNEDVNTITWVSSGKPTTGLVPPVSQDPMSSPNIGQEADIPDKPGPALATRGPGQASYPGSYDVTKPTCSLNLVCYRSGAKGCDLQQVQCILRSRFPTQEGFEITIDANENLVYTDEQFFNEMRRLFDTNMSSFVRRWFSLKSHKAFRILAYTPTTRPVVVPFDDFVLQEMMFAYLNPDKVESTDDWVQWVFRLRRRDKRHAVEFVEGWNSSRIAIAGTMPWLSSCIIGIAWTAAGGDVQSAFAVASFVLTSSSIILALLAIISSIESSGRTVM